MPGKKVATPEINALLELERREMQNPGTMPPALKAKLEAYRRQGIVAKIGGAGGVSLTEAQGKDAAFLGRALGANRDFEASGYQERPRSIGSTALHAALPEAVTNGYDASGRQLSEQARRDFISASLRLESGAAIGDAEFTRQNQIFFPQPGDSKEVIAQKARARARVIEGFRVGAGPGAEAIEERINAIPAGKKAVPGAAGAPGSPGAPGAGPIAPGAPGGAGAAGLFANAPPDDGTGGGAATIVAKAVGHPIMTEKDRQFAAIAQAAFNNGADRDQMDAIAKAFGAQPYGPELDTAIEYRRKGGKGAQILASKSGYEEPGFMQKALAPFAASRAGAVAGGVANGATLGGLDEIAGAVQTPFNDKSMSENIAEVNRQKELARAAHPGEFAAGEVGGGVATTLLAGGAAGARAAGALGARALATDAAVGATYGGLENNDNRVGGAVTGALSSVAGGAAGRSVMNRVAGAISPKVDPDVAFLRDKGVRLTPGQSIGPTASTVEEKLMSIPGPGDLIRNARKRAVSDFNKAYLDDALSHIGGKLPEGTPAGTQAMAHAQGAFNDAYDAARAKMSLVPDAQMAAEIQALDQKFAAGGLTNGDYDRLGKIYADQVLRRIRNGPVSGADYKEMVSRIGKLQDGAKRNQNTELADALGELKGALDNAARRSSPPEAVAALDAADKGYALFVRAEDAAKRRGGETGTFSPAGLDAAVQKADSTVRSKAYLRGDALGQQWSEAGKRILKNDVPDSGTAGRLAMGGLATGAGYLHPGALVPAAGLSAVYAPGVRDVASRVLAGDRGAGAEKAADWLRTHAILGTAAASPLALIYQQNAQP